MKQRETLITWVHDDGTAAVTRDPGDGSCLLTGDSEHGGGTVLEGFRPVLEGLAGDRMVQGGLLPPGSVSAEVVDASGVRQAAAAGSGAWLIVLEQAATGMLAPVRFLDSDARSVAPPLPPEWPRSPVPDAREPCPACGATSWMEVQPLDDSRGSRGNRGGGTEPTPFVVCTECGWEESIGAFLAFENDDETGVAGQLAGRAWVALHRRPTRAAMRRVDFAVYAAAGWIPRLGGWGSSGRSGTSSVTVLHGGDRPETGPRLSVETDRDAHHFDGEGAMARRALEDLLGEDADEWPERSEAGLTVWLKAAEKQRRETAARRSSMSRPLWVDGSRESFTVVEAGPRWAAVRRHGGLLITVTAEEVDPGELRLEALGDLARDLAYDF